MINMGFMYFDMTDIEKYQKEYYEETKIKYCHTKAYQESQKKTDRYSMCRGFNSVPSHHFVSNKALIGLFLFRALAC